MTTLFSPASKMTKVNVGSVHNFQLPASLDAVFKRATSSRKPKPQLSLETHPVFGGIPEDVLSRGTGGGGDADPLLVGFRFNGDGDEFFRFPQNGILLFLLLADPEDSACWEGVGGMILMGVAGRLLGDWRGGFDGWLFPPKNSDRPDVLVFKRGAGASADIAANPQAGGPTKKEGMKKKERRLWGQSNEMEELRPDAVVGST